MNSGGVRAFYSFTARPTGWFIPHTRSLARSLNTATRCGQRCLVSAFHISCINQLPDRLAVFSSCCSILRIDLFEMFRLLLLLAGWRLHFCTSRMHSPTDRQLAARQPQF